MSRSETITKSQADRIGEAFRRGELTADLIERLSRYREQLVHEAQAASDSIRTLTLYPVTPREGKSTPSIVAKLRRQSISLSRMQDIVGCRIVVDTVIEQEALGFRISARFRDARISDRRVQPSYGYRALHFILRWRDAPYEVQVRTRLQHAWAQAVERLSDRVLPGLKYGEVDEGAAQHVQDLSDLIRKIETFEAKLFDDRDSSDVQRHAAEIQGVRSNVLALLKQLEDVSAS